MNNRYKQHAKAKAITIQKQQNWMVKLSLGFLLVISLIATAALQAQATVRGAPDSFADLVEKLQPAVVNISTVIKRKQTRNPRMPKGNDWLDNEMLERFKDRYFDSEPRESRSLGSGFIISADGYVVTNNHVVKDASEITIRMVDGKEYKAVIRGRAEEVDLALLKIESDEKFPFVKWGDSDSVRVGDWALAIGNPYGFGGTVTAGIISGKARRLSNTRESTYDNYLQTDAPINRGNSGGPLFNMNGDVVGVNTVIISTTGGNIGIGFSIPASDAQRVIGQLKEYGKTRRGWLGVSIRALDKDLAEAMGLDTVNGAVVSEVVKDAPSDKAGVKVEDIIVSWDGRKVTEKDNLPRLVAATPVGKTVKMEILRREGEEFKKMTLDVNTGELKSEEAVDIVGQRDSEEDEETPTSVEGMQLAKLNGELKRRFRLGEGAEGVLILRVDPRSAARKAGLSAGMTILKVQFRDVELPSEVESRIEELREDDKKSIVLYVQTREGSKVMVPLKLQ
ncbi:Do family serine endopeptidase [Temperatibacter marinus]|uniref:Probable periplasmic serine endoprotease DegP-like n=1 Tax=Temperatibacter marinus TaxID=1456591 RepID=A0AA52EDK4_9PROT|nr:Do family serine endopeptidase [Temperatibacter marinus]WND02821.1 Do family serine endopeptidase [Temperatibacter marinus]